MNNLFCKLWISANRFCFGMSVLVALAFGANNASADHIEVMIDAGDTPGKGFNCTSASSFDHAWSVSVNGYKLEPKGYFFEQPVIKGRAEVFSSSVIVDGVNHFTAVFNGLYMTGVSYAISYHSANGRSVQICSGKMINSTHNAIDCGNVRITLQELNPELAKEIQDLKEEAANLNLQAQQIAAQIPAIDAETARLDQQTDAVNKEIASLNQALAGVHFDNFDAISPEQLADLIAEDPSIRQKYNELKAGIEGLREELRNDVQLNQQRTNETEATLRELYVSTIPETPGFPIPDFAVPEFQSVQPRQDGGPPGAVAQMDDFGTQIVQRMEDSLRSGDQSRFLGSLAGWNQYQQKAQAALSGKPNTAPQLAALRSTQERILRFVNSHVDAFGFFTEARIPLDVKRAVGTGIKSWNEEFSRDLKEQLNQWQGDPNGVQEQVFSSIRSLSNALNRLADPRLQTTQSDPIKEQSRQIMQSALTVSAEQTLDAVRLAPHARGAEGTSEAEESLQASQASLKIAIAFGDMLLGFTPVSSVKDFYEVFSGTTLTGEALSVNERAFAAIVGVAGLVPLAKPALKGIAVVGKRIRQSQAARRVHKIEEVVVQAEKIVDSVGKHGIKIVTGPTATKVDKVILETLEGTGNLTSKFKLSADEALHAGEKWVGSGYKEIGKPGSGVFRSADGKRQFRMDKGSLAGAHDPNVPHVHLEEVTENGRDFISNNHIPFLD